MPIEPPPSPWRFPALDQADEQGFVAAGADAEPATLLAAYRHGLFPMPIEPGGPLGWWSPDPRGVLDLEQVHVSRSLAKSMRQFEFRIDTAFDEVVAGCADPRRPHGWIDATIIAAYRRLFDMGWAHSIETWKDGQLVGGLYGLAIGGLFAAESKFHTATDASKAAVVALSRGFADQFPRLIDVQWRTDHLGTLGVKEISRKEYEQRLRTVLASPPSPLFGQQTPTITIGPA